MINTETEKIPIPEPKQILNELLSPSDIVNAKQLSKFINIAEDNTAKLKAEMERRSKLTGVKEALEKQDFNMLREAFKSIYGESMVSAGKQLLVSMLSLKGFRVDEEVHIEESMGQWVKRAYREGGLEAVYDWTTQIDTATQVVNEYSVVFDSEKAKEENKRSPIFNYTPVRTITFGDINHEW